MEHRENLWNFWNVPCCPVFFLRDFKVCGENFCISQTDLASASTLLWSMKKLEILFSLIIILYLYLVIFNTIWQGKLFLKYQSDIRVERFVYFHFGQTCLMIFQSGVLLWYGTLENRLKLAFKIHYSWNNFILSTTLLFKYFYTC